VDSLLFDRSNYDHSYALYRAAAAGQPGLVEKLLHQGAWVDELWSGADVELGGCECDEVCDSCGCCHGFALPSDCPYPPALHTLQALGHPLYAAAAYNQSDVCSLLLTQSIHPEIAQLCVHVAARSGHLAALQVLVQEGPPGASQPDLGLNPMFAAARHGHKEVVQLFLGLGADPYNTPGTPWSGGAYYTSCLVEAVRGGSLELVQLLLQEGMSLERDWQQVLETAVRQGDTKLVRLLIDSAHALAGALEQPQQQPATAASAADKTPGIMQQAQSARMCSG
jgi:ankyrin repeat protein